ncbi:MAG TPA: nucleoside triphosphate pyrophosphohydrolase [Cyclobacteriaceae bacterium]|nr:nucleoside triphosphate pyrophosphohydrolase [Cyclobacteriaceae bacterium]
MFEKSTRESQLKAFDKLLTIMEELREKCPWDRKQTIESLRHLTIEETFELSDAIIDGEMAEIRNELGDILLHIVFYAKIGSEKEAFDITSVIENLCDKLVRRHPHIYGDITAEDEETVKQNWEKIKLQEIGNKQVLGGVPRSLPAMIKAMRIQEKASGVGFDWEEKHQVWDKVEEEMQEFKEAYDAEAFDKEKASGEFGDLLFSLINYARFIDINPEEALEKTNKKFIRRFEFMEHAAKERGLKIGDMSLPELDRIWNQAKQK